MGFKLATSLCCLTPVVHKLHVTKRGKLKQMITDAHHAAHVTDEAQFFKKLFCLDDGLLVLREGKKCHEGSADTVNPQVFGMIVATIVV